jgi:FlaA1/EpsC-like NDP-sugar epimerase
MKMMLYEFETLRREVKKLMIDAGAERMPLIDLAKKISTDSDQVNPASLCMALTGHRSGERHIQLLERLREHLLQQLETAA